MKHLRLLPLIWLIFTASVYAFPIPDTGMTKCYDKNKEIPCPSDRTKSGNTLSIEGIPLKIEVSNNSNVKVYRWQKASFVKQYYSEFISSLFLNGEDTAFRWITGEFRTISHTKPDEQTIQTVMAAGDSGILLTQIIFYTNGKTYYQIKWEIANNGEQTYNDVRFLHGGDTYFAGIDGSEGHWDSNLQMIYLTNPDPKISGIMGFYGSSQSPPSHYMEDVYTNVTSAIRTGTLPDTVKSNYIDAGYGLQWNRKTLQPGESWIITAYEKWTEAGYVQVVAPEGRAANPRQTVEYEFTLHNYLEENNIFDLTLTSSNNWQVNLPAGSQINIEGRGTKTVIAQVTIPANAADKAVDNLTLRAASSSDLDINNSDFTTTTVDRPRPVISDIAVSEGQTSAIITWITGVETTSQVEYGKTEAYGTRTPLDETMKTEHSVKISGLEPNTTYSFKVISKDGYWEIYSPNQSFTTANSENHSNLTVTTFTVLPSIQVLTQSEISWTIQNSGQLDASGSWVDSLYLSSDDALGSDDTLLGEFTKTGGLSANTQYQKTEKINIPDIEPDSYYIIFKTDANNTLNETDETDNISVQPVTISSAKLMTATSDISEIKIVAGTSKTGEITLQNISVQDMSQITASVQNAPANITFQFNTLALLKSMTSQKFSYTVKATDDSVTKSNINVIFKDSKGNEALIPFKVTVLPGTPKLATNPEYLESGMLRGKQRNFEFELSNIGGASANNLQVMIPNVSWLKLVSPKSIGTLAAGAKTTITLMLKPSDDMALGPYSGELAVAGDKVNIRVNFKFSAVSDAKGNLKVIAEDEFTYYAEDKPNLAGAEVIVKDAFENSKIIAKGTTDETGIFTASDINEGRYDIEVSAKKHGTYRSTVEIVPGSTKEVKAFMSRQFVSYKWTVEPTEIEDNYRIVLEMEIETRVPAPVITVRPSTESALIIEGEDTIINIIVTNHGLIAANDVSIDLQENDKYYVEPLIKNIGLLPAMTSIEVPVTIRAKAGDKVEKNKSLSSEKSKTTRIETPASQCDTAFLYGKLVYIELCHGRTTKKVLFNITPFALSDINLNSPCYSSCYLGNKDDANAEACIKCYCKEITGVGVGNPCGCMLLGFRYFDSSGKEANGHDLGCVDCVTGSGASESSKNLFNDDDDYTNINNGYGDDDNFIYNDYIRNPSPIVLKQKCESKTKSSQPNNRVLNTKSNSEMTPSDINKYGGRILRYKVN